MSIQATRRKNNIFEARFMLTPFLKWPGGKRRLFPSLKPLMPKSFNRYFEPFLGGGSMLFALAPEKAFASDNNALLINCYQCIRDMPTKLMERLEKMDISRECFLEIRGMDRNKDIFSTLSSVEKAARFIYLNKTCFNGLYRVNRSGHFNTPFGWYDNPLFFNEQNIRSVSKYLSGVALFSQDYAELLRRARSGDFVYLDPPYDPLSRTSNFIAYNSSTFGTEEQIRLKKYCDRLHARKVNFMLSSSDTPFVRKLYSAYNVAGISAPRSIGANRESRKNVGELVIRNYE